MSSETLDLKILGTPASCVADFCLIPVRSCSRLAARLCSSKLIDLMTDGDSHGVGISRSGRRAASDAEEHFDVLDAFCGDDCW